MGQLRTANRRHRRATRLQAARGLAGMSPPGFLAVSAGADHRPANDAGTAGARAGARIEIVDSAPIPGGGMLQLARCGGEFSIQFCSDELMGSHDHVSEEALATMTCERLGGGGDDILIGGLGMGFTLRAALSAWPASARIVVAELVPEIVTWAEGPLAHLHGDSLSDPRVTIELADVHHVIAGADAGFDAILLDVDNGPDGFMRAENDRIYCAWGLASAYAALRPGGVLAVWSAYPDAEFRPRLEDAGFSVEEVETPAYSGSVAERHHLWFATKHPHTSRPRGRNARRGTQRGRST